MTIRLKDFPSKIQPHARRNERCSGCGTPDSPFVGGWSVDGRTVSYDNEAKAWLKAHGFVHHGRRWLRTDDVVQSNGENASMNTAIKDLVLDSIGLPPTFPLEMMPDPARQFIADTKKGMPASELIALAKVRGFRPLWKALPHMEEKSVFGLGLDVDGLQVPLMAKMVCVVHEQPATHAPSADPRQQSLF